MVGVNVIDVRSATQTAIDRLDPVAWDELGHAIRKARHVYTVGNGGSASHASHCAADLRRLAGVGATCLNDSIADYSAGVNDDKRNVYARMLERAGFVEKQDEDEQDLLIIFTVGGADRERGVSEDLYHAADWARRHGALACVFGRIGDIVKDFDCIEMHIDCPVPELITPVVESVMPLVWHALVAGPLKREEPVWR